MGVSGAGKSSVASGLATATGGTYIDADDLHPVCNIEKMASGQPLEDSDRWGWLDAVSNAAHKAKPPVFIACSALSGAHRARLHGMQFLYLQAPQHVIAERLARRKGHFMRPELLTSQYTALEAPKCSEAFIIDTSGCTLTEVIGECLKVIHEQHNNTDIVIEPDPKVK